MARKNQSWNRPKWQRKQMIKQMVKENLAYYNIKKHITL